MLTTPYRMCNLSLSSGTNEKLLKTLSSPGEGFRKSRDAVIES